MKKSKRFRLACADFTFPLLPHDGVLDLIAALEMDGIDIGLFEGRSHLWPSKEFRRTSTSAKTLFRKLKDRGLAAADVFLQMAPDFTPFAINHPESARRKKARDWFLRTLEYAAVLGSAHVTTLPGVEFADEPKETPLGRSHEELAWRVDEARRQGIIFSVEAHTGSIVPTPVLAEKLVKAVPGLSLTLDYTHFTRLGMTDAKVEPLTAYATHFHVRGASKGRLQTPFKTNVIDYARVVQLLKKADYRGYLGIEYVWIDWEHCNETDNISETILFRDFLRSQFAA
jgi:sugar phosphate isomerase/epimerase